MTTQSTTPDTAWHTLSVADALTAQGVDPATGLSAAEVEQRREVRPEQVRRGQEGVGLEQVRAPVPDPMQIVLLGAGPRSASSSSATVARRCSCSA